MRGRKSGALLLTAIQVSLVSFLFPLFPLLSPLSPLSLSISLTDCLSVLITLVRFSITDGRNFLNQLFWQVSFFIF